MPKIKKKKEGKKRSASEKSSRSSLDRLKKMMAATKARLEILETMEEMGRLLNSTLDEREVRKRAMEAATRLMHSEVGSLLLIDPETKELFFEVALGEKGEKVSEIRLKPGEGIAGWVAETGEAQIVNDAHADSRFFKRADDKSGFVTRNMICVPVRLREKTIGVLQAINKKKGKFNQADLEGFRALSGQVAIAIENAGLYKELKETFFNTVSALGDAIEAKDAYTGGHTKRVLEYSMVLGKRLGLSPSEMDNLKLAAALHDIGKIGIEDRILGKPGKLDPEESEVMESHAVIGARIVENIRPLREIVPGIRHHHEQYDGKGYPDVLKGEEIPLIARVISVCDTFDAMTSDRPYRRGLSPEIAVEELRVHAGTQFDPNVVKAFLAVYEKGEIKPILHRIKPVSLAALPRPGVSNSSSDGKGLLNRIESTFKNIISKGEKALIAYVMAGDPTLKQTEQIVLEIEKAGADVIEIGVPFSDPVADGPTIQAAAERALRQGVTLRNVLDLVSTLRRQTKVPLILMTYCNPIYAFGIEAFFKEAKGAGVDGLIIPDLPPEEAKEFILYARRHLIDLIFLIAPTTPPDRIQKIVKIGAGFIYYVPLTGVTGSKLTDKEAVRERLRQLKSMTDRPIAAGFGISTPEEAKQIAQEADGIIVGSALVRIIETSHSDPDYLLSLATLVSSLKRAIRP